MQFKEEIYKLRELARRPKMYSLFIRRDRTFLGKDVSEFEPIAIYSSLGAAKDAAVAIVNLEKSDIIFSKEIRSNLSRRIPDEWADRLGEARYDDFEEYYTADAGDIKIFIHAQKLKD